MKKVVKLTSGLLAGVLFLSNFNGLNITEAAKLPVVTVETSNNDITTKIIEVDGKDYLAVTATKDVANVQVKLVVGEKGKEQTLYFKHAALKAGETVNFEVVVATPEKALPKTSVEKRIVTEVLALSGVIKTQKVEVSVSYDVEIEEVVAEPVPAEEKTEAVAEPAEAPAKEAVVDSAGGAASENLEETKASQAAAAESAEAPAQESPESTPQAQAPAAPATTPAESASSTTVQAATPVAPQTQTVAAKPRKARSVETPTQAASTVGNKNFNAAMAAEVFAQLNAYRTAKGLAPLKLNTAVDYGTEIRAVEFAKLVAQGKSGASLHKRLDGSGFQTAFNGGFSTVHGENLAYSIQGASGMMAFWKSSPSHNAAMLNAKYKSVSIKVYQYNGRYYGVQIFSTK